MFVKLARLDFIHSNHKLKMHLHLSKDKNETKNDPKFQIHNMVKGQAR